MNAFVGHAVRDCDAFFRADAARLPAKSAQKRQQKGDYSEDLHDSRRVGGFNACDPVDDPGEHEDYPFNPSKTFQAVVNFGPVITSRNDHFPLLLCAYGMLYGGGKISCY